LEAQQVSTRIEVRRHQGGGGKGVSSYAANKRPPRALEESENR
jgi:hypothetical protein